MSWHTNTIIGFIIVTACICAAVMIVGGHPWWSIPFFVLVFSVGARSSQGK